MSDERLRSLERRWRETGDARDERRWLEARVRGGDLDPEALALLAPVWAGRAPRWRLEVLAYAGDTLARQVLDEGELVALATYLGDVHAVAVVLAEPGLTWEEVGAWAEGLMHWGGQAAFEVSVALLGEEARALYRRQPPGAAAPWGEYEYEDALYEHDGRLRALADAAQALPELRAWLEDAPLPEPRAGTYVGPWAELVWAASAVEGVRHPHRERAREALAEVIAALTGDPDARLQALRTDLRRALRTA